MKLIPFSSIPERWDWEYEQKNMPEAEREPYPYTPEQEEAAIFLSKMDWEGGLSGLLSYGGSSVFPEELRGLAERTNQSLEHLRRAVDDWAAERGVEY